MVASVAASIITTTQNVASFVWEKSVLFSTLSVLLGYLFLYVQFSEYNSLLFTINSNALTSCFYLLTGFHGFHVIIGTIMLTVQLLRTYQYNFSDTRISGFLYASGDYHFIVCVIHDCFRHYIHKSLGCTSR